jgi:hypothetical protein
MKTIRYTTTLFYYDGTQVFEARDAIGGHYVAVLTDSDHGHDRYLVTGVPPERLRQFRSGTLDLRTLLMDEGKCEWFITTIEAGLDEPLSLIRQDEPLADSRFLPDPGFVLHDSAAESEAVKESRARNNLVLEVAVEPPEAADEHRIRVGTLASLLGHVQTLVKHAYGAANRELSLSVRRQIDRKNAHLLDVVVPAAPGSFRVLMEAAQKQPDVLGDHELARALERIDLLLADAADPHKALANAKKHCGHLAGAYLRLLRFLVESKTGLRYSWAEPTFTKPRRGTITMAEAGPLVDALSGVSNLGAEPVTLEGELKKADVDNGAWRIAATGEEFTGKIKDGGPSLRGLKLGSSYRFMCLEEIEEFEGTGREQRTLYLTEHEPV